MRKLWAGAGAGEYLFCTCDCLDFLQHGDIQQSREEFWKRLSRSGVGVACQGDYASSAFARIVGLVSQPLPLSGHLAWWQNGTRSVVTETSEVVRKKLEKAADLEYAAEVRGLVIDFAEPDPEKPEIMVYHVRRFHHVLATPKHTMVCMWACKHIIAVAKWLFTEQWPSIESFGIGWGYAQRDLTEEYIMLNGQVAVVPLLEGEF